MTWVFDEVVQDYYCMELDIYYNEYIECSSINLDDLLDEE